MPYSDSHWHLTWGGEIGNGTREIWQCGLRLFRVGAFDSAPTPTTAQLGSLFNGALKTFHQSGTVGIASGAKLSWLRMAPVGVAGNELAEAISYDAATPLPGGVTSTLHATPQSALCVTLYSGSSFGDANYGRFYLPWNQQEINPATGRIIGAPAIATAAATFVGAVNTWADSVQDDLHVVIMSQKGAGATKRAAQVWVGDVMDTQRRRRNRLDESYSQVAV